MGLIVGTMARNAARDVVFYLSGVVDQVSTNHLELQPILGRVSLKAPLTRTATAIEACLGVSSFPKGGFKALVDRPVTGTVTFGTTKDFAPDSSSALPSVLRRSSPTKTTAAALDISRVCSVFTHTSILGDN